MNKTIKFLFAVIFLISALFPLTAAAVAGTYRADGTTVCYEGLVPCGLNKPYWPGGSVSGGTCQGDKQGAGIPCQLCHFVIMFNAVIDFFIKDIVFPVAILLAVISGVLFLLSGSNPGLLQKAKGTLLNVATGLLLIFAAWIIINFLLSFIGLAEWTGLVDNPETSQTEGWFMINCPIKLP